ncbi:semaphorin-1A-like [Amphiura filiformis]|uniref:semaphorin-1A-like n=1 Tax=Amphiura filiformis TaxID=82378 RepID=UPI003B21B072
MTTAHLSLFIIVVAALQTTCTRVPTKVLYDEETPIADITTSTITSLEYVQVLYIDGSKLVVGKKETVMSYDLDLSNPVTEVTFPLVEPSAMGALPCAVVTTTDRCFTFVNVIKEHNGDWYYCGTSGVNPQCWKCAARICTTAELAASFDVEGLVTGLMGTDQPFLITSDDEVFGAAATEAGTDNEHAIVRVDVSDFSTNRVETETDNEKVLTHDGTDFVGEPIEYNDHVYFFFREIAEEYENIDKIRYSRVARICKNDAGGGLGQSLEGEFTTYQKARLNCSITGGEYPSNYDYIRDIYQSTRNSYTIYAVVTDTPIMDRANSAICVYDMREIELVFDNSPFKGQASVGSLWLSVASGDVPVIRPGTCDMVQATTAYQFLREYPLMNQPIPNKQAYLDPAGAWDRDSDSPLMLLGGLYITQLVVDENDADKDYDVFFLGSIDGKVYKAYVFGVTPDIQTRIIQKINLGSEDNEVLSMILHSATLYVGTTNSLHAIPVACCNVFSTVIDCILVQSPYCSWNADSSPPACEASTTGEQCLADDVYSCGVNLPVPECFSPKTGETDSCTKPTSDCQACCTADNCALSSTPSCDPRDCLPDYVRVTSSVVDSESTVVLDSFVRAPQGSVWGTTTFACTCGCPPGVIQEITARSTVDGLEYLLGSYSFAMSSCTNSIDITLTFEANGQSLTETITVDVDQTAPLTDSTDLSDIRELDQRLRAYDYQVCWWKQNKSKMPLRPAESVYCYNCPSP